MADDRQSGGNRPKSVYTQSQINSYERQFTAMSFTFVNGSGLITLSPIFDEFVGKEPKKGDNVYDHDEKMNFLVDAQTALRLKRGVIALRDNDELKNFVMTFGGEKNRRTLSLFKPKTLKLQGNNHDNYILKLTQTKDDGEEKMYHLLQRSTDKYKNVSNEEFDDEVEIDLELLVAFCEEVVKVAFGTAYHGVRRGGGSAPAGGGSRPAARRRNVEEDDDGESSSGGGDSDDDAKPSKPAAKTGRRSSLSDEFKDE
jgi:hypothetical protein